MTEPEDTVADDWEARGVAFRAAMASVPAHLRKQSDAELARIAWLQANPDGAADDPVLVALTAAMLKAEADVAWCRGLVIACGEAVKGCRFEDVPNGPRPSTTEILGA